jgi:hypothetical protein
MDTEPPKLPQAQVITSEHLGTLPKPQLLLQGFTGRAQIPPSM